jgi:hypothetical protein
MTTFATHLGHIHAASCGCADILARGEFSRRRFLALGAGVAAAGLLSPAAFAASGDYEEMLLNCVDPRFVQFHVDYMNGRNLKDKDSHFVIAGGPAALVTPKFADWHKAFWDNLATSVQLHNIKKVIAI